MDDYINKFMACLTEKEREVVEGLNSPFAIQAFLDSIPYRPEDDNYCALQALRERRGHCFDGGLLGAVLLRRLGFPPVIVNLIAEDDDDHILAIYKVNGNWGAVAKSNMVGLRFREPIYRSLRELVLSYFEFYYNLDRMKSLRSYTPAIQLSRFDHYDWMCSNTHTEMLAKKIASYHHYPVIDDQAKANLSPVDDRLYQAGLLGSDPAGLYDPKKHPKKN